MDRLTIKTKLYLLIALLLGGSVVANLVLM
jgi:hypothetical protein